MNFNIETIQVKTESKPTAKGSYMVAEITYKNLGSGKIEAKKVVSFANKEVYSTVSGAKQGDQFTVTSEKNEKTGYWDWLSLQQAAPGASLPQPSKPNAAATPIKSTYETPEERAKKQVYIVKQSSIGSAIQLLSVGAKTPPALDDVLSTAQKFFEFVFADPVAEDMDVTLDIPEVE
jgi:hypothetical protein